ncbi:hypothetical protein HDU76_010649, partial [Blyttiomyces sp. JEL0837]
MDDDDLPAKDDYYASSLELKVGLIGRMYRGVDADEPVVVATSRDAVRDINDGIVE